MEAGTVAPLKTFLSHPLCVQLIPLGILIWPKPHLQPQLWPRELGPSPEAVPVFLWKVTGKVCRAGPGKGGGMEEGARGPMPSCPLTLNSQSPRRAACGSTAWRMWTRPCSS